MKKEPKQHIKRNNLRKINCGALSINSEIVWVCTQIRTIQTGCRPIFACRHANNKRENPYAMLRMLFAFQMRSICLLPYNGGAGDGQGGLCSP